MRDPSTALRPDPDRVPSASARARVGIIGGGPGGYEAALTAARLGADVTLIEDRGIGGAAVLTDVVPSKSLIATAEVLDLVGESGTLGIRDADSAGAPGSGTLTVDLAATNSRVRRLAAAQSADIRSGLEEAGVRVLDGRGRLAGPQRIEVIDAAGTVTDTVSADVGLIAVGGRPRELPGSPPDGKRILTWTQLYELSELPEHLVVVGSGVTGAEFASAYRALGSEVTLVSSRDQVLPGTDRDAAQVLERAFSRRGITLRSRSRAASARVEGDRVRVALEDGGEVVGSHLLVAVGAVPSTDGLGLEGAHVRLKPSGHIDTDRVSRTSVRGLYAAGDCTGVYPLASVAAAQGRTAIYHALGEAVSPLIAPNVASAVFTSPEIATVGYSAQDVADGVVDGTVLMLPLATNPRAKMQGIREGFVKLIVQPGAHTVLGGVVTGPRASELIHPITLAVSHRLTAEEVSNALTVYPSLSGSIAEAARQIPTER